MIMEFEARVAQQVATLEAVACFKCVLLCLPHTDLDVPELCILQVLSQRLMGRPWMPLGNPLMFHLHMTPRHGTQGKHRSG